MHYQHKDYSDCGVRVQAAQFSTADGTGECHVMFHVSPEGERFPQQLERLHKGVAHFLAETQMQGYRPIVKRYFLSDVANQSSGLPKEENVAMHLIQQPPLDGSKVALWMYLQTNAAVEQADETLVVRRNGYTHLWHMGMEHATGNSAQQTEALLTRYEAELEKHNATLRDHCVRTWFYVRDVDTNYAGLVTARLENFIEQGLTPETHYISSTGIGGHPVDRKALVQLGGYALTQFLPGQQRYLYALSHMNRTIEYGVTFERGTLLEFGDRAHIYISGTASIDNKGNVVHVGDIVQQTQRMWENVEQLFEEAQMTMEEDAAHFIVYLRDTADYDTVQQLFKQRFPDIPTVITLAPVCRPEWLIEMECIAIAPRHNETYRPF